MILNWERGKIMFGNSEDLYRNELYSFANVVAPPIVEKAVNSAVIKNANELKDALSRLKGSAKFAKKLHLRRKTLGGARRLHSSDRKEFELEIKQTQRRYAPHRSSVL